VLLNNNFITSAILLNQDLYQVFSVQIT